MGLTMDVGTELRNGRERRGKSLAALADSTKISVATLQAMERGDFTRLPGGIFTRGFLRAYAREVGLDPEETVQHYLAEFEPPPPSEPIADVADAELGDLGPVEMEELERRNQRNQLIGGAVILLVGPFLYFTFLGRYSNGSASVAAQSPPPAAVIPAKAEVGTTGSAGETSVASRDTDRWAGKLHLEIRPTESCWVSAIVDGRQGLQRLMTAGEHETIDATDEVTLRIGDPSTCAYSINGTVARQAGEARQPATLHITRQNYKDFLNPAPPLTASVVPPARPTTILAVNALAAASRDPLSTQPQR
jgi:cytoskeleton protein RodZ